ncbi:MAG: tetratricopeptide repeat protein [Myxococcales bacterium]
MPTALLAALILGSSSPAAQLQKAKQLFQQGRADYQAGRFRQAIEEFLAADKLKASAALIYNVAQAYEKLGDLSHAVEYYQDYLSREPHAADRDKVKATIQNLQAKLQAEPAAPVVVMAAPVESPAAPAPGPAAPALTAPAPAPPVSAPEAAVTEPAKPHRSRVLPITLGAVGIAAGIVAIVGIVEVASYQSTVSSINSGGFKGSYADAQGQASQANTWGDAAIALGVVAVAGLTGAGLTW